MSNALAIAAVTATLKDLLNNGVVDHDLTGALGTNVMVTALPPDRVGNNGQTSDQLNLFLYGVTHNAAWRNAELPSMTADGRRRSNPPLALDLHYQLTAYGASDFHAEILLGYAMQVLHDHAVLTRDDLRTALGAASPVQGSILPSALQALTAADLADQIELVKIVPAASTIDDISRLWSALQTSYRTSVWYTASVVLITSQRPVRAALPVERFTVAARAVGRPRLASVARRPTDGTDTDGRIRAGDVVVFEGTDLRADVTRVRIGEQEVVIDDARPSAVSVPLDGIEGLRPGVQTALVVHDVMLGDPPTPHRGVTSNPITFVVHPVIALPAAAGGSLAVGVVPSVGRRQRVTLYLTEADAPANAERRTLAIPAPAGNGIEGTDDATAAVTFPLRGVAGGRYLVRIAVDGVESILSTSSGTFNGPIVEVLP